jgi:hypothetical protein
MKALGNNNGEQAGEIRIIAKAKQRVTKDEMAASRRAGLLMMTERAQ